MKKIAISGPSGAGKTSLISCLIPVLQVTFKVYSFSISTALKKLNNKDVKTVISEGEMADDEKVTWPLVQQEIAETPEGTEVVIVDGFPRTEKAALLSVDILDWFFFLEIDEEVQLERLLKQREAGRRDKTAKAIANQLALRAEAEKAAQIFERTGKLTRVDANQAPTDAAVQLLHAVNGYLARN